MPARPIRVKLKNELGISTTLPEGEQYLHLTGQGQDVIVTCPGPAPGLCAPLLVGAGRVFRLVVPEFEEQMPAGWHAALPEDWEPVALGNAAGALRGRRILHYAPATRLFPSVYAPLLARARTAAETTPRTEAIWLPAPENGLVISEIADAARNRGLAPRLLPQQLPARELEHLLTRERPRLFLSVNFHGLDPYGENQARLEAAGVPVAVWSVDNPLHLLTAQKNLLWKRLPLFVTDDWFVEPLRELGADARHLPLAASPAFFGPGDACPDGADLLFVGRSAFPDRDRFFAASRIPGQLAREAQRMHGRLAHFGWWRERLGLPLWPGNEVRTLGLGAETASAAWRRNCLAALARETDLTVIGDEGWRDLIPGLKVDAPVDYYTGLAGRYRAASFTLNLTSLLLPHGLTQRHFDVWACGGFLLTDDSPGLDIFPQELTREVTFAEPAEAAEKLRALAASPARKHELRRNWQRLILGNHTYADRLHTILNAVPA